MAEALVDGSDSVGGYSRAMRLLHTSDWHLGRNLESASLHEQHESFLAWLVELATDRKVDAVLVAGDVYDRTHPSPEAVKLLDQTLTEFARRRIPVILTPGNHDSAVRLGFGRELTAVSGIHFRTEISSIADPIILSDEYGAVGIYGIPYLHPDLVLEQLEAERSHESVLRAAAARIRAHAKASGIGRTVVLSHAFVRGGSVTNSERGIRVGGIGDAPADVFDGITYVALGHLHRPQAISLQGSSTTLQYSGSPMPFSFGERDHVKSVTIVDIGAEGQEVQLQQEPVRGNRPLIEVSGALDELLDRSRGDLARLNEAFVKVILTDRIRPTDPMLRLRSVWPRTLLLEFKPDGANPTRVPGLPTTNDDPFEVCCQFVEQIGGEPADDRQQEVLREVIDRLTAPREAAV